MCGRRGTVGVPDEGVGLRAEAGVYHLRPASVVVVGEGGDDIAGSRDGRWLSVVTEIVCNCSSGIGDAHRPSAGVGGYARQDSILDCECSRLRVEPARHSPRSFDKGVGTVVIIIVVGVPVGGRSLGICRRDRTVWKRHSI